MTEMQQVVRLMLDRLEADLATDEVSLSMAAFQVLAWLSRSKENMLRKHVAVLGKALKLSRDVSRDFAYVAKTLANLMQTCKTQQMSISQKVVWSWVLVPQWRSKFLPKLVGLPKDLETLIFFYLSVKINTTTLERNLGELCRQLAAHTGRTAEDSSQLTASLLEVALDGPQREEDLFERIDDADGKPKLSPTDFGRACARLWVEQFGRRFRYKYLGRTAQKKLAARPGSFKAVLLRREAATDKLAKMASSGASGDSFVPGLALPLPSEARAVNAQVLHGTRWAGSAPGSFTKGKFETHTERKKERCLAVISILASHNVQVSILLKKTFELQKVILNVLVCIILSYCHFESEDIMPRA
jgi:hypothetical protein